MFRGLPEWDVVENRERKALVILDAGQWWANVRSSVRILSDHRESLSYMNIYYHEYCGKDTVRLLGHRYLYWTEDSKPGTSLFLSWEIMIIAKTGHLAFFLHRAIVKSPGNDCIPSKPFVPNKYLYSSMP